MDEVLYFYSFWPVLNRDWVNVCVTWTKMCYVLTSDIKLTAFRSVTRKRMKRVWGWIIMMWVEDGKYFWKFSFVRSAWDSWVVERDCCVFLLKAKCTHHLCGWILIGADWKHNFKKWRVVPATIFRHPICIQHIIFCNAQASRPKERKISDASQYKEWRLPADLVLIINQAYLLVTKRIE